MTTLQTKSKFPAYIKWLIILVVACGLALILYYFFRPKEKPPEYLTAQAVMGDIEQTIMATGKVKAINSVDVGSEASGKVEQLLVDVGSEVKAGDIIAQIEQIDQKNAVSNAQATLIQSQSSLQTAHGELAVKEAELKSAHATLATRRAELDKAQKHLERMAELINIDAISRQDYDDAKTAVAVAKSAVDSAFANIDTVTTAINNAKATINSQKANVNKSQTDVQTAQSTLSKTTITAPISGTVVSITTKQGQTVNAMQSAPTIVTLADLSRVRINVKISEADVVNVSTGLPARFNIIGNPDQKYDTTLTGIEPAPETISTSSSTDSAVYYIGYLDVDNHDRKFRIDMTAQVNIITNAVKNVLTIPSAALNTDNGKHTVKVVGSDGFAKAVPVTIGLNNRVNVEIKSGLSAGDTVVIGEATTPKANNRNQPPL